MKAEAAKAQPPPVPGKPEDLFAAARLGAQFQRPAGNRRLASRALPWTISPVSAQDILIEEIKR